MDHQLLNIYNILLDYLDDEKALKAAEEINDYINHPDSMKIKLECIL